MLDSRMDDLLPEDDTTGMLIIKLAPGVEGLAGLTMPPTAIGRPARPTVVMPQPTDQIDVPSDKK